MCGVLLKDGGGLDIWGDEISVNGEDGEKFLFPLTQPSF